MATTARAKAEQTPEVPLEPQTPVNVEPEIPVSSFIENASHAIPVAGLLADRPELVGALLPRADWQAHLDAYLTSHRP